jgi:hypothetical protein
LTLQRFPVNPEGSVIGCSVSFPEVNHPEANH